MPDCCYPIDHLAQVREFHIAFGAPVRVYPALPSTDRQWLRHGLIREELSEFADALYDEDIVAAADALGDLLYVVYGAALEFGIDIHAVFDEIHRSNMSKLGPDGKPVLREDGKVLKGPYYRKPNIEAILAAQRDLLRHTVEAIPAEHIEEAHQNA